MTSVSEDRSLALSLLVFVGLATLVLRPICSDQVCKESVTITYGMDSLFLDSQVSTEAATTEDVQQRCLACHHARHFLHRLLTVGYCMQGALVVVDGGLAAANSYEDQGVCVWSSMTNTTSHNPPKLSGTKVSAKLVCQPANFWQPTGAPAVEGSDVVLAAQPPAASAHKLPEHTCFDFQT